MIDPTPPAVSPVDTAALRARIAEVASEYLHACPHCPKDKPEWVAGEDQVHEIVAQVVAEREATHAEVARTWEVYRLRSVEQKREWRRKVSAAEEENAGLRAELARAGAHPIPDDAAVAAAVEAAAQRMWRRDHYPRPWEAAEGPHLATSRYRPATEGCRRGYREAARLAVESALPHLSTPTTGPAPAAADGEQYVVDFEPGLYGPFATVDSAHDWAACHATGVLGGQVTWSVRPLWSSPAAPQAPAEPTAIRGAQITMGPSPDSERPEPDAIFGFDRQWHDVPMGTPICACHGVNVFEPPAAREDTAPPDGGERE
jgi:hypothetical protein